MSRPFNFKRSPEDAATYAKWRRGMCIFLRMHRPCGGKCLSCGPLFAPSFSIGRQLICVTGFPISGHCCVYHTRLRDDANLAHRLCCLSLR
jgi:hypothetical protein